MCKGCLPHRNFDNYCKYKNNIDRWINTGKSHEYITTVLGMGCSAGKRNSLCCGLNNGGKSRGKGKGKNKCKNRY